MPQTPAAGKLWSTPRSERRAAEQTRGLRVPRSRQGLTVKKLGDWLSMWKSMPPVVEVPVTVIGVPVVGSHPAAQPIPLQSWAVQPGAPGLRVAGAPEREVPIR
jgi:hypothetical protein